MEYRHHLKEKPSNVVGKQSWSSRTVKSLLSSNHFHIVVVVVYRSFS